ncbi:MAG: rhamnulokinase [Verrucomicrobia bacterium]|nr:rhamnulokinase [Verrucomicrobiota bacterium]
MTTHYLACDLGAESGRLILGTLADGKLALEEVHRFANVPVEAPGMLHWDIPGLFTELKVGLKRAAQLRRPISSFGCDSWGVDYLLFDANGEVIPPTYHYRDSRTAAGVKHAYAKIDWPTIFAETGIQFMPLNTLFQLAAESPERLDRAHRLLLIADGFNFMLSGVADAEESLASTSQLYSPRTRSWSGRLLQALDLPARLFPPIVPSGTKLGLLRDEIARESGLAGLEILATCSHDTAAAVAAVPTSSTASHWAYISSGTWSLLGVQLPVPIINDTCRELNFTNEIGYGGSVRLLKNIVGLWIVQECRRAWAQAGLEFEYAALTDLAGKAPPFVSLINPTDPRFIAPGDMPRKIAEQCRETGQTVPADPGAAVRCVLESLALLYRRTLRQVERITGSRMRRLHIVGGGSRNALLNQFTADAVQIPVLAGPAEATAAGNILVQAIALGHLPSLREAREVVRNSLELVTYEPQDAASWNDAYGRFENLFWDNSCARI